MSKHLNGQGHHPTARPYNWHNYNCGCIKVTRCLISKTWDFATSDDELVETMVVEMGCLDSGMWYVDTAGCGMLQANDANPPPKHGFVRNAMRYAAVLLFGLMLLVGSASCNKDLEPEPDHPNIPTDTLVPDNPDVPVVPGNDTIVPPVDTIQPGGDTIVPGPGGDTIVPVPGQRVYFEYGGGLNIVSFDTLERYQNDPAYDSVILRLAIVAAPSWTPSSFKVLCDSLRPRFTRFPKLRGEWGVEPYEIVLNCDSMARDRMGIAEHHKDLLKGWHYWVCPQVGKTGTNAQPQVYKGSMMLPRNNCRGGRGRGE